MRKNKPVIYQIFTRLFGNKNIEPKINGSRHENGVGKFRDISKKALSEIKKLGITHIWYTGIIEHAIVAGYPEYGIQEGNQLIIKGKAGSPYAIKDYYDVNPDLAVDIKNRMSEFQELADRTRKAGMKVIIDFVPNHLAREYKSDAKPPGIKDFGEGDDKTKSFDQNNNYYYIPGQELVLPEEIKCKFPNSNYTEYPAKATGNDRFLAAPSITDWYETTKLNYGIDYLNDKEKHFTPIPDTWKKMEHILLFWAEKGIDAFRCDMVEMVPVEFWNWAIYRVKSKFPKIIFIAEIYNPEEYSNYIRFGNFDFLYDKVGLYDILKGIMLGEKVAGEITKAWQNLNGLDENMLRFLENHDEQRIASGYFADNPWKALPAMVVAATLNKGPLMIYFGQEVGEPAKGESGFSGDDGRTTIFDYRNVPEHQKWMNAGKFDGALLSENQKMLRSYYQNLLNIINQYEAISTGEFYDIMWYNQDKNLLNPNKIHAYLRFTEKQILLIVVNFNSEYHDFTIKIPEHAFQILNIQNKANFIANNILNKSLELNFKNKEIINKGINLTLGAFESLILNIY